MDTMQKNITLAWPLSTNKNEMLPKIFVNLWKNKRKSEK
jgi:hypothetical protein